MVQTTSRNRRDEELRRMLVAFASEPTGRRSASRGRLIALIAAFTIAGGVMGGAVSAAAINAAAPTAEIDVAALAASVQREDTDYVGTPIIVTGSGTMRIDLGEAPEGTTQLTVAFDCGTTSSFDYQLDLGDHGRVICDGPSDLGAMTMNIDGGGDRSLSIRGDSGSQYTFWASWSRPPIDPIPTRAQAEALADSVVTEAEYHSGFDRYSRCLATAGYQLAFVDETGAIIDYSVPDAAVTSGADDVCYKAEFAQIDSAWQVAQ